MKAFLPFILFLSFTLVGFAQQDYPDSGFTNKAEGKINLSDSNPNEGRWVEYEDLDGNDSKDTNAPFYVLKVYKDGESYGIERAYYKSGKLYRVTPYKNGKTNGIEKEYYENGVLKSEMPYIDDKVVGIAKWYSESGKLYVEETFMVSIDGGEEVNETKFFDGKGKLYQKHISSDTGTTVYYYDENGNEIKK